MSGMHVPGGQWALRVPDPAPRRHDEDDLLHAAMQYLRIALPHDAIAHHSPGEGKRTKAAQALLSRSGYCKGWPDIEIVWRGRIYFIELKAARGVLSASQRETHRRLIYCGAEVMLCRSVEGVEAALREACVPLRASVSA
jgi:hypothetical protein